MRDETTSCQVDKESSLAARPLASCIHGTTIVPTTSQPLGCLVTTVEQLSIYNDIQITEEKYTTSARGTGSFDLASLLFLQTLIMTMIMTVVYGRSPKSQTHLKRHM